MELKPVLAEIDFPIFMHLHLPTSSIPRALLDSFYRELDALYASRKAPTLEARREVFQQLDDYMLDRYGLRGNLYPSYPQRTAEAMFLKEKEPEGEYQPWPSSIVDDFTMIDLFPDVDPGPNYPSHAAVYNTTWVKGYNRKHFEVDIRGIFIEKGEHEVREYITSHFGTGETSHQTHRLNEIMLRHRVH